MPDHLDFLRIRGLESAETEVFQGLGAASQDVSVTGGESGGSTTGGTDLTAFLESLAEGFDPLMTYLTSQATAGQGDTDTRSIGRSRAIWGLVPLVSALPALMGGLPPAVIGVGTVMAFNHILHEITADVEDIIQDQLDPYSLRNSFKKMAEALDDGLLRFGTDLEGGIDLKVALLKDIREALEDGLLRDGLDTEGGADLKVALLKDIRDALDAGDMTGIKAAIERLQLEIEFADGKASFKSGVFEY